MTTAFTGATRIIDARFASEISPKITFLQQKEIPVFVFPIGLDSSDKAHYGKGFYKDAAICMA